MNRNTIWGTVAVGLLLILGGLANQQEAVDVDSTPTRDKSSKLVPEDKFNTRTSYFSLVRKIDYDVNY